MQIDILQTAVDRHIRRDSRQGKAIRRRRKVKILENVQAFLTVNSLLYFPLALVNIVRFTIQGMGYSLLAVLAGVCEMIARSIVGFVFVPMFGYIAACFASPVAWIAADMFLIPAFIYSLKHLEKGLSLLKN